MLEEIDGKPQEFPKTIYFYTFFTASRTWVLLLSNGIQNAIFIRRRRPYDGVVK